jgi:hypothetical protein
MDANRNRIALDRLVSMDCFQWLSGEQSESIKMEIQSNRKESCGEKTLKYVKTGAFIALFLLNNRAMDWMIKIKVILY